jgi:hypothetical protein
LNLWLDPFPPNLNDLARAALETRNALGFLSYASNEYSLELVYCNAGPLESLGIYEVALLEAFTATRTNNRKWPIHELRWLFENADISRLRAAGDPLPSSGRFTIYRGVAGRGPARRVGGFSWTGSLDKARWFADRAGQWGLYDPAVYQLTVDESSILAYVNHRQEDEFIIVPSASMKPDRIDAVGSPLKA